MITSDSAPARLATVAALLLASATLRDKGADGDSVLASSRSARRIAARWRTAAIFQARSVGLNVAPLLAAIDDQSYVESTPAGRTIDEFTHAAEVCAGELFAHSAVLAGRTENVATLRDAGRAFGRIAHLLDAIVDYASDIEDRRFNPVAAAGLEIETAATMVRAANEGLRFALSATTFTNPSAIQWFLVSGTERAIARALSTDGHPVTDPQCLDSSKFSHVGAAINGQRSRERHAPLRAVTASVGFLITSVAEQPKRAYCCCDDCCGVCCDGCCN